ncbi:hypothetical protein H4219_004712 [Mycoemilia scoparia]|uniref:Uncharacterized protein n=1 Tax=Mycoemilia scoparia TaxID=417184 RepID=A0A9W8DRE4_9FUNG|nr:hypothetical protein H4219_004712 [Mycoemilia scoparia]
MGDSNSPPLSPTGGVGGHSHSRSESIDYDAQSAISIDIPVRKVPEIEVHWMFRSVDDFGTKKGGGLNSAIKKIKTGWREQSQNITRFIDRLKTSGDHRDGNVGGKAGLERGTRRTQSNVEAIYSSPNIRSGPSATTSSGGSKTGLFRTPTLRGFFWKRSGNRGHGIGTIAENDESDDDEEVTTVDPSNTRGQHGRHQPPSKSSTFHGHTHADGGSTPFYDTTHMRRCSNSQRSASDPTQLYYRGGTDREAYRSDSAVGPHLKNRNAFEMKRTADGKVSISPEITDGNVGSLDNDMYQPFALDAPSYHVDSTPAAHTFVKVRPESEAVPDYLFFDGRSPESQGVDSTPAACTFVSDRPDSDIIPDEIFECLFQKPQRPSGQLVMMDYPQTSPSTDSAGLPLHQPHTQSTKQESFLHTLGVIIDMDYKGHETTVEAYATAELEADEWSEQYSQVQEMHEMGFGAHSLPYSMTSAPTMWPLSRLEHDQNSQEITPRSPFRKRDPELLYSRRHHGALALGSLPPVSLAPGGFPLVPQSFHGNNCGGGGGQPSSTCSGSVPSTPALSFHHNMSPGSPSSTVGFPYGGGDRGILTPMTPTSPAYPRTPKSPGSGMYFGRM